MNTETLNHVKEQIDLGFSALRLPEYMKDAVIRWVFEGIPSGSFLMGIFLNQLSQAVFQADDNNKQKIVEWVQFLYWYLPSGCYGNPENVKIWKGLNNAKSK